MKDLRRLIGFALVELLVAIGIVTILIAILLPAIWRNRRKAMVLACPIAYIGADSCIHLTNSNGSLDVGFPIRASDYELLWSPDGLRLAFGTTPGGLGQPCSLNPLSGAITPLENSFGEIYGWLSSSDLMVDGGTALQTVYDAETGKLLRKVSTSGIGVYDGVYVTRVPPHVNGYYLSLYRSKHADRTLDRSCIALLRKDLTPCKTIWESVSSPSARPCLDRNGELVAWSEGRGISFKHITAPASKVPETVLFDRIGIQLFDWTDDGNFLIGATAGSTWTGSMTLVIGNRQGKIIRQIAKGLPAEVAGIVASYRHYGHQ